ncbi:MAG: hypothetical protein QXP42_04385 [Candidatus Micrarchaeia archaeon]
MKAQSVAIEMSWLYLFVFLFLVFVGSYLIARHNTWIEFELLYGNRTVVNGFVQSFIPCEKNESIGVYVINTTATYVWVFVPLSTNMNKGDSVRISCYNISGGDMRMLANSIIKNECEPSRDYCYAVFIADETSSHEFEVEPWQRRG